MAASESNTPANGWHEKWKKRFRRIGVLGPKRLSNRLEQFDSRLNRLEQLQDIITRSYQRASLLGAKYPLPPIPPKHLQTRVVTNYYPSFFEQGQIMIRDLENVLKDKGLSMSQFDRILDFGCGCGRVLIPLSFKVDPKKLSGTDIDIEATRWLRENYPEFSDVDANPHTPPSKYADASFDFVYSISIFTHLPEDMQHAWLKELARIIKPGGHGIFTTHGENQFHHVSEAGRSQLRGKGFYYQVGPTTEGLPDFYRTSYHTPDYIKREWSRYFELLAIRIQGMGGVQDVVLVRKR